MHAFEAASQPDILHIASKSNSRVIQSAARYATRDRMARFGSIVNFPKRTAKKWAEVLRFTTWEPLIPQAKVQRSLDALRGTQTVSQPLSDAGTSRLAVLSEPVFTVSQIAEKLQIDRHLVSRLFAQERGVICIGRPETQRGKRKYRTLRVPASVFNRVIARLSNK